MKALRILLCLSLLLPVSCASDSNGAKPKDSARPERKTMSQRMSENNGFKKDSNGNWVPQNDKRSPMEGKGQSPYFKGEYEKKAYKAGEYSKTSFWGNKEYGRSSYDGNTDGSRFQKSSGFDGQGAREATTNSNFAKNYKTDSYATSAAHEAGNSAIAKPIDAETEGRRKVYQAPEIIDWQEQRKLSLDQSRGILGH